MILNNGPSLVCGNFEMFLYGSSGGYFKVLWAFFGINLWFFLGIFSVLSLYCNIFLLLLAVICTLFSLLILVFTLLSVCLLADICTAANLFRGYWVCILSFRNCQPPVLSDWLWPLCCSVLEWGTTLAARSNTSSNMIGSALDLSLAWIVCRVDNVCCGFPCSTRPEYNTKAESDDKRDTASALDGHLVYQILSYSSTFWS